MRELVLAAAALLCAWNPVRAQAAREPSQSALTISFGTAQETRRDDTDSPLAFTGTGPGGSIEYEWARAGRRAYVSFTAGSSTLSPRGRVLESDVPSREGFSSYALEAGIDWRLRGSSPRAGTFAFGVEYGASATLTRHYYPGQDLNEQDFILGTVTLSPTARWTRRVGAGEVGASLAIPVLAWVDHPYADVRFASQVMNLHFAPLSQFHQGNGELSYAFLPESRVGITAVYRLGVLELEDVEPVRRVSQSLSIAVVRRFGARP
jgi:hypothetical protein